tara:strand:+ start:598 stop:1794 length:1197 start_codon:yes stop_codon:yes gene_type:complete
VAHQILEIKVNGARRKVLVQGRVPVYYPNLYVSLNHIRRALNTQQKLLEHIGLAEDFLAYEGIDLVARLQERPTSHYLTDSELSRFVDNASRHKSALNERYAGVRRLRTSNRTVGRSHARQRVEAASKYFQFLYEKLGDGVTKVDAAKDLEERLARKVRAAKPAWKKRKLSDVKGLTDEERELLLEVMHPQSQRNPFASEALKLRNYIILLLGLELGLRRAEMLLIKISDISWNSKRISVVDLEDERVDLRTLAPKFKTHERVLEMGDELAWAIKKYIDVFRLCGESKSEANKHPFLLVAHRRNEGKPLSLKALDGVFPRVGKVAPQLRHIHPHLLRHDSVCMLLENARAELEVLTPEDRWIQTQIMLTTAFGWSKKSDMPQLYGAKFWGEVLGRRGE